MIDGWKGALGLFIVFVAAFVVANWVSSEVTL